MAFCVIDTNYSPARALTLPIIRFLPRNIRPPSAVTGIFRGMLIVVVGVEL